MRKQTFQFSSVKKHIFREQLNESFSQFDDGLRHGQGVLRIKKELTRNVMGEMIDSKVSFIEGSFVADKLEGPGTVSSVRRFK